VTESELSRAGLFKGLGRVRFLSMRGARECYLLIREIRVIHRE